MGKYMRKCRGLGEVAIVEVPQVGVRTRARALAMEEADSGTAKRRKVGGGELKFSSSLIQLRSGGRVVNMPENSVSQANSGDVSQANSGDSTRRTASEDQCASPSLDDHVPASCCSSNGSTEVAKGSLKFVDLEEEGVEIETSKHNFDSRDRRESTPSSELRAESGELDSTVRPSEANFRRQSTVEKMPSEAELEEFFNAAEKDIQKRFAEKYNFDIVKDEPLEGRHEWVRLKPYMKKKTLRPIATTTTNNG